MNVVFSKECRPIVNRRSAGVALVITLILISVITFLAITFIALARRERGQVTTTLDQTTATFAADSALERAKAELVATILANTNVFNFDLLVSTNYTSPLFTNGVSDIRNVNFDESVSPFLLADRLQNLTNLLYSPRVPVFVTNKFYGSNEFRYYIDLNRDGFFTHSGWLVVTNENGGFYDLKTNPIPAQTINPGAPLPNNVLVRYFSGDPQFIGILPHPEDNHSESNKFLSRYAFIVLPAGKTLDVNYIHNYAKRTDNSGNMAAVFGDGFRRNQGVASWENNLGSFLVDLNTNAWPGPNQTVTPVLLSSPYFYDTNNVSIVANKGAAFDDALAFLRYRYGGGDSSLFPAGAAGSPFDQIDMYSMSPLMENLSSLTLDNDGLYNLIRPWQGSDNTNHFFSSQEFFDFNRFNMGGGKTFVDRLRGATTYSLSTYDRYTYYRLLSQLGTDSAPEPERLNLNYINIWPFYTTNYVSWDSNRVQTVMGRRGSEVFFRNAADRLVKRYFEEWRSYNYRTWTNIYTYTNIFDTDQALGASRIPVFVKGRFVYSPSLHRQLQLAANLWDGLHGTNDIRGPLPTVFRPLFTNDNGNIYINDFEELINYSDLLGTTNRDLANTNVAAFVQKRDLIYGVPLVIGARKGLPNFNEFASETIIQITRKAEVRRPTAGAAINETNQMLIVGISNVFGAEFWNSYTKVYQRPVEILATNFVTISLTNDFSFAYTTNLIVGCFSNMPAWAAWKPNVVDPLSPTAWSFAVPMLTNQIIIPDLAYHHLTASFDGVTNVFDRPQPPQLWFPQWVLGITNRLVAIIKEPGPTGRVIDYVQLNGLNFVRNLTLEIAEDPLKFNPDAAAGLWATNSPDGIHLSDYPGLRKQIEDVSMGAGNFEAIWKNNSANQPSLATKYTAIANFRSFVRGESTWRAPNGVVYPGTNSLATISTPVPFSPTAKWSIPMTWQANDPIVHYMSGDMEYLEKSGVRVPWTPPSDIQKTLVNLSKLNERFKPWGGNPNNPGDKLAKQSVVKDPGITKSDDWQFPTNKLPGLGWIGRLHRGTPWQTVYLKSTRVDDGGKDMQLNWKNWTGNKNTYTDSNGKFALGDFGMTQPEEDRTLLELFTTAPNENAGRGQLPVNQSGLAAWSAVFGGMVALTNNTPDQELIDNAAPTGFGVNVIDPVGVYDPADTNTWGATLKIVEGINRTRANKALFPSQTFSHMGDVLATPELSEQSPFLNLSGPQKEQGINDVAYEWLPQQMLSLVRMGEPRFVIYSFGQTLKPAQNGIYMRGSPLNSLQSFNGVCTNYQITAETATRAVVRIVGSPDPANANNPDPNNKYPPRIVVESFNILPPD